MRRYWIGVASYDHVKKGVLEEFAQVCHGKQAPLSRMSENDVIFYYSPTNQFGIKDRFQSFSAMGRVKSGNVYQVSMGENFHPYRVDVEFYDKVQPVSIHDLIDDLDFIDDKQHYGSKLRYGHLEISKKDAMTLWHAMKTK